MFVHIRNTTREVTISSGDIFLNLDLQSSMYLITSSSVPLIINFRAPLIISLQGSWCRRLDDSLDTHDLQFRVLIPDTLTVPNIEDVSFLCCPDATISDVLSLHLHLLVVSLHMSQGPGNLLDKRFQFVLADLVNDPHNLSLLRCC